MGVLAIGAAVVGGVMKAIGDKAAGDAKANALDFEATQMQEQAKMEQLQANKFELDQRQEVREQMASFNALQSTRNMNLNGASNQAIRNKMRADVANDTRIAKFNSTQTSRNLKLGAKHKIAFGKYERKAGLLKAAGTLVKTVGSVASQYSNMGGSGKASEGAKTTLTKGGPKQRPSFSKHKGK